MKSILLIGLGRFGRYIAQKLYSLDHHVTGFDIDEARVQSALSFLTTAQVGDATDPEFLATLGIHNFDACVVTIGENFQTSLETASLLKELRAKRVISRASNEVQEKFLLRNGADEIVFPEKHLAAWTAIRCASDTVRDYIELDDGYVIMELTVPWELMDKTVLESDLRRRFGINVLGIRKEGEALHMNITPDTVLAQGSSILILGPQRAVRKCFRL